MHDAIITNTLNNLVLFTSFNDILIIVLMAAVFKREWFGDGLFAVIKQYNYKDFIYDLIGASKWVSLFAFMHVVFGKNTLPNSWIYEVCFAFYVLVTIGISNRKSTWRETLKWVVVDVIAMLFMFALCYFTLNTTKLDFPI